jgi:anaerobic C4-dicarboxylate transporter DcuA/anaerobic C4-dicarboxylate transporter DcuB
MENVLPVLSVVAQVIVVLGCVVLGTRKSGISIGLFGAVGAAILISVFGLNDASPPVQAVLIVLAVIVASAIMQIAGGMDYMVYLATKIIRKNPKRVTLVAPLITLLFCMGSGTGNMLFPLIPIIQDVSYNANIRPSKPIALANVAAGCSLACTPASAACVLFVQFSAPYNFDLADILKMTIPITILGIIVASFIVGHIGKNPMDDVYMVKEMKQGKLPYPKIYLDSLSPAERESLTLSKNSNATEEPVTTRGTTGAGGSVTPAGAGAGASGGSVTPSGGSVTAACAGAGTFSPAPADVATSLTAENKLNIKRGKISTGIFVAGILLIVLFGFFAQLRPANAEMGTIIQLIMYTGATITAFVCKADLSKTVDTSIFKSGMVAIIALLGISWMVSIFMENHQASIIASSKGIITTYPWILLLGLFVICVLTTSQSTATIAFVPLGLSLGIPPYLVVAFWSAALTGICFLPINGIQIASASFDYSKSVKLGKRLIDNSFVIPLLLMLVTELVFGVLLSFLYR